MKTFKIVQKEVKVIEQHVCDICGSDMIPDRYNSFDASEITIEAKIGSVVPGGDLREKFSIDCCSDCFQYQVVPLIENKFKIRFKENSMDLES
ncbi:hypothetical protein [Peribacillus frigoritolerans]|uniref:hypothetical protein n=1 Tax=Peribacillus frigoritolerans TaxID=450367 RepID=UPI0020798B60|nr:hypothetical protein [Peribacillus frigoritolerans]USK77693.1 hypothetical protein LIT31_26420 [Peribacillus frigoritolerans]USK77771.1 hypothetical protein LIT31_25940 [Peribacillus frigoritolerans]USK77895.1 hypothetical protein LIT31_26790 [Peribacillus frigoritolerans]